MNRPFQGRSHPSRPGQTLERALSKLGYCSRSQARAVIADGRVRLNGAICQFPEATVDLGRDRIEVDGERIWASAKVYVMLNKPRGLVTTRSDEQGRDTVYQCFAGRGLPWLAPVGRLDKASEGLILFSNDNQWADRILSPKTHLAKRYHVQVDCLADTGLCERLVKGSRVEGGDFLTARRARVLRRGPRNSWLELEIDEGKNRHLRRLLEACGVAVLRLMRVAIGPLWLGTLPKGEFRHLTEGEVAALRVS